MDKYKFRHAFTLAELVIVLAMLAVLTSVLVPSILNSYGREAGKCADKARGFVEECKMYSMSYGGKTYYYITDKNGKVEGIRYEDYDNDGILDSNFTGNPTEVSSEVLGSSYVEV
ncbi:MAG: type II secretion system GspH family protein, partial [Oscillospiraceae bacterium]|nr:type II secretion system GspH family protein [Oscillospiraceae bacterium]